MQRPSEQVPVTRLALAVIVVLYLAHALPLYFFNVAMPAILRRQGVDTLVSEKDFGPPYKRSNDWGYADRDLV